MAPTLTPTTVIPPTNTLQPTPRPTVSGTATSTGVPEPIAVSLSRQDAEREVLSWFDPTREPHIEWSKYVRRNEMAAALQAAGMGLLRDVWRSSFEDVPLVLMDDDPLVVVVASTRGIDPLSGHERDGQPWLQPQAQPDAVSPHRVTVLAVFNAITGQRRAAMSWPSADPSALIDTLTDLRAAAVNYRPDLRPTETPHPTSPPTPTELAGRSTQWPPTPTPTLVPASAYLTAANMPPELRSTFAAYPLVPGSSWTWRYTFSNADVRWVAEVLTETIEAAWLEDDFAVVRSRVDAQSLTPERNRRGWPEKYDEDDWEVALPTTTLRYVAPGLVAANRDDIAVAQSYPPTALPPDVDGRGVVVRSAFVPLLPDVDGFGMPGGVSDGPATITTKAGSFEECWAAHVMGGASWGAVRWFCPGVGDVQYGYGDAAMYHASTGMAELIRWHRGTLPER